MNKESLKEFLSSRYQGWSSFLNNVIFPIFGEDDFEDGFETELLDSQPERKQLAEATGIRSIKQVGMMYVGVEPLLIFDVTVSDRVMMERNRVNIQRLIRAVMDQFSCAFMLFHYEDNTRWDWRFTYCRKSNNKAESTDSKRYTFLLGPGQSCRTATDNFMALYDKRASLEIKDIENAFNVEALSKEFFGKYKAQYEAFVNYMVDPVNGIRQDYIDTDFDHTGMTEDKIRDREEKPIRDYVKKLLGRIVFLHFLQKKGWLGVPAGKEWGEGDRDFMLRLFKNATERQKENFLDDILEDLFAEGLDRNRSDKGDLYDTEVNGIGKCRIPYLNGGLFERDNLDKKSSHFPAAYFDSLLTMLSQYNFTIDENDPNDAEVGIDPEMLGRIFENLLEDNKDKGAFYTPKEIVQYMCRESLIAYLQTDQREEDKDCIRQFVTTHDATLLGDLKEDIDQKLCAVKICDPAIGSGAFPMGLLRELFFCRSAIEPNIVENAANIKRHIIQNNIYGVDIERGAVDIARLRFWLSLIVDEKSPEALPNLDFKIMQGNSLLESYEGMDLSKLAIMSDMQIYEPQRNLFGELENQQIKMVFTQTDKLKDFQTNLKLYFETTGHDERARLRKAIDDYVRETIIFTLDTHKRGEEKKVEQIQYSVNLNDRQKKVLAEAEANISHLEEVIANVKDMELPNSQFFLWHTWFHDVFSRPSKEGFDIVIGNPPYKILTRNNTNRVLLSRYIQDYNSIRKANSKNLFTLFIELAVTILASKKVGIVSFIIPEGLFKTRSYKDCVGVMEDYGHTLQTVSFSDYVFENAITGSLIFLHQNGMDRAPLYKYHYLGNGKFEKEKEVIEDSLLEKIEKDSSPLSQVANVFKGMVIKDRDIVLHQEKEKWPNPFILGKHISKWSIDSFLYTDFTQLEIVGGTKRLDKHNICPRIVIRRTGAELCCALLTDPCLTESTLYSCWPKDTRISIYSLLGILNSSLMNYYNKHRNITNQQGFPQILMTDLQQLPIKIGNTKQMKSIENAVINILRNPDIPNGKKELDNLVFQLYSLSDEDIIEVEG